MSRIESEIKLASRLLNLIDGKSERTYGTTCGNSTIGPDGNETSFTPFLRHQFVATRGAAGGITVDPSNADLGNLPCLMADQRTFQQIKKRIETEAERGTWMIYCAHSVARGTGLVWDVDEHRLTVEYLAENKGRLWVAPVIEIAQYVARQRR